MNTNNQEIEAKFYVSDLKKIEMRLRDLKAHLIQPSILEQNIRFDLPDGSLRAQRRVLRLRRDTEARLTYKGASKKAEGILSRREIEFVVEDFEKAELFLEALGYQSFFFYEKYRTTYELQISDGFVHIMLDELPYGNFVEIEGESVEAIRSTSDLLGLKWETAIPTGYHLLFERLRESQNLPFHDLAFENFKGLQLTLDKLDIPYADK